MSKVPAKLTALEEDASLEQPLRRVAYEAGMLVGLEAMRDEQSYHRRRLNRHQYWLHGSGTLTGMAVAVDPPESPDPDPVLTRLKVSPGIGIDGLGREVVVNETYCIDLGDWLKAQSEASLREGYDEAENLLWLKVTVRYRECEVAKQPVLSGKLNLSTDAVQPSRRADSVQLELIPEIPPAEEQEFRPWAAHGPIADDLPEALTGTESDFIETATPALQAQLQMNARLLHALDGGGVEAATEELLHGARLLLARLSIAMPSLDPILDANEGEQVVNPGDIEVNNLLRPFLLTASQIAWLLRTTET